MRKWMSERLKRRKKTGDKVKEQPKTPEPLQPKYFEDDLQQKPEPIAEIAPATEQEPEAETGAPARMESAAPAQAAEARVRPTRRRRRRGGRGRSPRAAVTVPTAEPTAESAGEALAAEPIAAELPPRKHAAIVGAPSKGIVVLAIGLPGSGKSSWFKRQEIRPLSSDMVRAVLFDDIREQRFQDLVFSNLRSMLKARLIARRPMNYVDATNLTPQERQHWIKLAKDFGYEVQAVFFDVPLEICIERHQRRDRVVPEDVMRRMAAKLKPPTFDEGFSKITVVRVKKKEQEA
jgi:predicted kinase